MVDLKNNKLLNYYEIDENDNSDVDCLNHEIEKDLENLTLYEISEKILNNDEYAFKIISEPKYRYSVPLNLAGAVNLYLRSENKNYEEKDKYQVIFDAFMKLSKLINKFPIYELDKKDREIIFHSREGGEYKSYTSYSHRKTNSRGRYFMPMK